MSKAVLVMDTPESCRMCQFHYPARDMHTGEYMGGCRIIQTMAVRDPKTKPDWCPLKQMPEKKPQTEFREIKGSMFGVWEVPLLENKGWNDCIDAITGGDDHEK